MESALCSGLGRARTDLVCLRAHSSHEGARGSGILVLLSRLLRPDVITVVGAELDGVVGHLVGFGGAGPKCRLGLLAEIGSVRERSRRAATGDTYS